MASQIYSNNITPSNSATIQIGITPVELWIQLIVFYGLLAGVCSTLINISISMAIVKSKKLRTRFFVIIFFICLARACLSSSYISISIYRILRTLNVVPTNIKRIYCYFIHFHLYYTGPLELVLMFGLVIDRILAIAAIAYYRKLTYKQAVFVYTVATSVTIMFQSIGSLLGLDLNQILPCVNMFSPTAPIFVRSYTSAGMVLWALILSLYIFLIIYIKFRLVPQIRTDWTRTGDQTAMNTFNRQSRLLPMIKRIIFMHCGLTLVAKITTQASLIAPPSIALRLVYITGIIATMDQFLNSIILLASHEDLRNTALPHWLHRSSMVNGVPQRADAQNVNHQRRVARRVQ